MTSEELKLALRTRAPVVAKAPFSDQMEYERVSGIVYRADEHGFIHVKAELQDKCNHSITVIDPELVSFKEDT